MIRIELPEIDRKDISIEDLYCCGLDVVKHQILPDIDNNNYDPYSTAIVNRHNNEILGLILISPIGIECFDSKETGCFINGCGIVNNINNEIYNFIVNQLITRTEFLFRVGRKDDDTLATDYFCLQPNTEEECEEYLNDYGMTKHSYINYSILSKRNTGTSVSLKFLKRYFT